MVTIPKVRQSQSLEALENVDPVLNDNPRWEILMAVRRRLMDGWMRNMSIVDLLKMARHPLALHVKADALYHLGNFEHALVYYHRGLRFDKKAGN